MRCPRNLLALYYVTDPSIDLEEGRSGTRVLIVEYNFVFI